MIPGMILIVEDEATQRRALAKALAGWGHEVAVAADANQALDALGTQPFDLVLTDLRMPGSSGIDLLHEIRNRRPDVAVVLMTAFGTVDNAVEAMRSGAVDFLPKPIDLDRLEAVTSRALAHRRLLRENKALRRRLTETGAGFRLLGSSTAMAEVLQRASRAAETDATVLIQGGSGTGKELLARSLHDLSRRADGPFIAVNCAALPETLLESELFGHRRGAFTGADRDRDGRVQAATGGTLFLDEIGDLPPAVQVKLLRFLQDHEFTPVGGDSPLQADVRVVTATHRDLRARIDEGEFREDLFFRLHVVHLQLPDLADRREDIPELAAHFLERSAHRYGRPARTFSAEAMAALMGHDYRGNVRELENVIEQAVVMSPGEVIHREDLPELTPNSVPQGATVPAPNQIGGDLPRWLETIEKKIVLETLASLGGNQSGTARQLGLTESGLRYKLSKWNDDETVD